jgi:hypothetical protein
MHCRVPRSRIARSLEVEIRLSPGCGASRHVRSIPLKVSIPCGDSAPDGSPYDAGATQLIVERTVQHVVLAAGAAERVMFQGLDPVWSTVPQTGLRTMLARRNLSSSVPVQHVVLAARSRGASNVSRSRSRVVIVPRRVSVRCWRDATCRRAYPSSMSFWPLEPRRRVMFRRRASIEGPSDDGEVSPVAPSAFRDISSI